MVPAILISSCFLSKRDTVCSPCSVSLKMKMGRKRSDSEQPVRLPLGLSPELPHGTDPLYVTSTPPGVRAADTKV